jgi:hypothetical protein
VKASVGTPREQRQGTHLEVTKGSYRSSFGMVHEIITREQVQKKKIVQKVGKNSTKIVTHQGGNVKNRDYVIPGRRWKKSQK